MAHLKIIGILYFICFTALSGIFIQASALAQEPADQKIDVKGALKDFSQLSSGDKNSILSASGLPQAKDFDLVKIVAYIIFGGIGFVAFTYGKKNSNFRPLIIGIALMVYPYFISATLVIYIIGIALTAALYFWRE